MDIGVVSFDDFKYIENKLYFRRNFSINDILNEIFFVLCNLLYLFNNFI